MKLKVMSRIHCLSRVTASGLAEAASPCRLTSRRLYLALNESSHPLLRLSHSELLIFSSREKSCHFSSIWSPVTNCPPFSHSQIQVKRSSSIFGYFNSTFCFVRPLKVEAASWNDASFLTHQIILGWLIAILGFKVEKCQNIFDWLSPLAWYHSRTSTRWE